LTHTGRIDAIIESDENAAALWRLMQPEEDGGLGAQFYVCGRTQFAVSVMESLKRVIYRFSEGDDTQRKAKTDHILRVMVANGRYLQDIFTTYSNAISQSPRMIDASELVLHNNPKNGYWIAVSGRVYDVSEFVYLHPGGDKIMMGNAGIDATKVYQSVMHHVNPEVDAMIGMYEIGAIRRLNFGTRWGVALGPAGLFLVPLDEVFRVWMRYLYLIVEMQNAINNDYSFLDKSTTYHEPANELTPLKLQYVIEAHKRFVNNYVDGVLNEDLQVLWSVTIGLCDAHQDIRWMKDELARIQAEHVTVLARRCPEMMWEMVDTLKVATSETYSDQLANLAAFSELVQRADKWLFEAFKTILRDGVVLFETHQSEVIQVASGILMYYVKGIPGIVEEYYAHLAQGMVSLNPQLSRHVSGKPVADDYLSQIELPGHGTRIDYTALQQSLETSDD